MTCESFAKPNHIVVYQPIGSLLSPNTVHRMAAVQRTPTPVDIRSRRAFIESMEEELKRVHDHLDRRQWKNRNGSTSALDPLAKSPVQARQWYTLARSNPATKRRVKNEEKEAGNDLVRVSSAQDNVMRTSSLVDSCSSSSKSPTPEPTDVIRVKSPSLPLTAPSLQLADFSMPTSSDPDHVLSPSHHPKIHPSFLYSSSLPPASPSNNMSSFNETPLLVKEMPFGLMQSRVPNLNHAVVLSADEEGDNEEEDEEDDDDESSKEVMPSAFGDLYMEEEPRSSQHLSQQANGDGDNDGDDDDDKEDRSSRSVDDLMQHITPPLVTASLNRKEEDDEGIGKSSLTILESSKSIDDNGSAVYEFQRYQRMQALKEEKAKSEMLQMIDELKEQLREKDNDMMLLRERMHVEVKVREERIKKLMRQHARSEKEKWDLLKKAREAAERSVHMRTKLDLNENQLRSSVIELERVNDELSSVKAANKSLRLMVSDLKNKEQHLVDNTSQTDQSSSTGDSSVETLHSDAETQTINSEGGSGLGDSLRGPDYEDWEDMLSITSSQYDSRDITPINTPKLERGKGRRSMKKLLNRLRRTGSAGKHHSTSSLSRASVEVAASLDNLQQLSQSSSLAPTTLTRSSGSVSAVSNRHSAISLQEAASDPSRVLDDFKNIPFSQWNTRALVAWMEIVVGMPHYISNVRQHVTSGHAMLALSNSDLEKRLYIPNPLHRRRLRLAIEEYRAKSPSSMPPHPHIAEIDHNWVAYTWAIECGIPHISASLYNGMVNGKVLNSLSKEDLKKYLKISKRMEQLSFLSGVELLRMHDFDREAIKLHRQSSQNPLYWTNNDVCEWLRNTDLEAYADSVIASGVHGALLFLERGNFTSENLANIIHIPPKSALRKQLATHLAKLFSTEEITSIGEESLLEEQTRVNPSPTRNTVSPTSDGSPHPMKKLMSGGGGGLSYATSNPDVSENEETAFNRHSRERTSLRESLLRSVGNPPPPERTTRPLSGQRPLSQVCSTTTV